MIELRIADLSELQNIWTLNETVKKAKMRKDVLSKAIQKGNCFVANNENKLVGYIVFSRSFFENWFITLLYVEEEYRRKGIATMLIKEVERQCTSSKLFISTNASNQVMQQICEKREFKKSGMINDIGETDSELFFVKYLCS